MTRVTQSAVFQSVLGTLGVLILGASVVVHAQSSPAPTPRPGMVALKNNHPRIDPAMLKGPMDKSSRMTFDVVLALRNKDQLDTLIEEQQNPASPNYHHWLTSDEFKTRFGPNPADYEAVAKWLKSEGFSVVEVNRQSRSIRCAGTTAQVDATFNTAMASAGNGLFTNTADPQIPAHFDGIIGSIQGLDNMRASMSYRKRSSATTGTRGANTVALASLRSPDGGIAAQPNTTSDGITAFAPADLVNFYKSRKVLDTGVDGGGDCLAIIGDSDYLASAVTMFNSTFSLPVQTITTVLSSSKNGTFTNPGRNGDESEALLDLEWSHAAAPGAATKFYLGNNANTTTLGIIDAMQKAVNENACSVISTVSEYATPTPMDWPIFWLRSFHRRHLRGSQYSRPPAMPAQQESPLIRSRRNAWSEPVSTSTIRLRILMLQRSAAPACFPATT